MLHRLVVATATALVLVSRHAHADEPAPAVDPPPPIVTMPPVAPAPEIVPVVPPLGPAPDAPPRPTFVGPPPPPLSEPPPSVDPLPPVTAPAVYRRVHFGAPGQVFLSANTSMGLSYQGYDNSRASSFSAYFSPGLDVFVVKNLSLGGDVAFSTTTSRGYAGNALLETKITSISVGARIGYAIPIAETVSLYPRLTIGVAHSNRSESLVEAPLPTSGTPLPLASAPGNETWPYVTVFVPFVFSVAPHAIIGVGPVFNHAFGAAPAPLFPDTRETTIGGQLLVGGTFGGPPDELATDREGAAPPRFGDAGRWVLGAEARANGGASFSGKEDVSSADVTVAPSFDYFVLRNFALGAGAFGSYARASNLTTNDRVVTEGTAFGGSVRVSGNVPLGPAVSLLARVALSPSLQRTTRNGFTLEQTVLAVDLFVPVLVHPAPHFFFGLGPFVSRDLIRKLDDGRTNPRSAGGLRFTVGIWF